LLSHGLKDEIVPIVRSREINQKLIKIPNSKCELIEFDGFHEINRNVVEAIQSKIKLIF